MSIGLSELGSSNTESVFNSFKDLASEIASTVCTSPAEKEAKVNSLVTSIINTMSDQGAINPVFNKALADLRSNLLPTVIDNWSSLDDATRDRLKTMGIFFCKMHLIVNFATETDKCLKHFETNIIENGRNPYSFNSSESGAARLVRTAAKALPMVLKILV